MSTNMSSTDEITPVSKGQYWTGLWFLWSLITALSGSIGLLLGSGLILQFPHVSGTLLSTPAILAIGVIVGEGLISIGQWLILRRWLPHGVEWIVRTSIGAIISTICSIAIGFAIIAIYAAWGGLLLENTQDADATSWVLLELSALILFLITALGWLAIGATIGVSQKAVLQRLSSNAREWLRTVAISWVVGTICAIVVVKFIGASIGTPLLKPIFEVLLWAIGGSIHGAIVGVGTGFSLIRILKTVTPAVENPPNPENWQLSKPIWTLVGLLVLGYSTSLVALVGIQPCNWLDIAIGYTGCQNTLEVDADEVVSIAYSPDGEKLTSGSMDGTINTWSIADKTLLDSRKDSSGGWASEVVYTRANSLTAIISGQYAVQSLIQLDNQEYQVHNLKQEKINVISFSPDRSVVALASEEGYPDAEHYYVYLVQMSSGNLIRTLEGHIKSIDSIAFSPDGTLLAAGAMDGTIIVWRISDGAFLYTLQDDGTKGWNETVFSLTFSPDGKILASGHWSGKIRFWNVADGTLLRMIQAHESWVVDLAFAPDGNFLASSGTGDNTIKLWQVSNGKLVRVLDGYTTHISCITFSPDGIMLAAGGSDGEIEHGIVRLWQIDIP